MIELISIIVPTYNNEKFIVRCIDSILEQTYQNLEIIIVNDGSSDDTDKIIKEKYKNNSKIKYFINDNYGVSFSRNFGLNKANGNYIMFVDGDDKLEKDYVEKCFSFLKKSNLDIVRTGYKTINNESNEVIKYYDAYQETKTTLSLDEYKEKIIYSTIFNSVCCCLFKKSIINDIRFSINIISGEDLLFNIELLKNNPKIGYLNSIYYCYYHNVDSITKKQNSSLSLRKCKDIIKVINKFYLYDFPKELIAKKMYYEIEHYVRRYILESDYSNEDYMNTINSILKSNELKESKRYFSIKLDKRLSSRKKWLLVKLMYKHLKIYILVIRIIKRWR